MKLEGKITFLVNQDGTSITIRDKVSGEMICEVTLTPEQLSMALSRLSHTPCEIEVVPASLDRLGKTMEHKKHTFVVPEEFHDLRRTQKGTFQIYAQTTVPDGWVSDGSFSSQDSFFTNEDGKKCARVIIRRWVKQEAGI